LLFIAQKVKKGDFTVTGNWSSTALFDVHSTGPGADLYGGGQIRLGTIIVEWEVFPSIYSKDRVFENE
jgi:hypothetical protein